MKTVDYSIGELLACIVARELSDEDNVAIGLNAELMLAASFLAQKIYAPNLRIRHGLDINKGKGDIELNPAAWTSNRNTEAYKLAEYNESHDYILSIANGQKQFCDTFFISGIQIDKHGNTNLIGIKGDNKEGNGFRFRGPGSIGTTSIAQFAKKYFIFSLEHSKRRFVEKVDYVSAIGYDIRKKYGISGGPLLCITPLCVFDFEDGLMRLKSVHSHSSLNEVLEKTGFAPIIPEEIAVTKEPAPEELEVLREIDKDGILKTLN